MLRQSKLAAAAILYREMHLRKNGAPRRHIYHPDHAGRIEKRLLEGIARFEVELRDLRESRAFRTALDHLMPGWVDIDLVDYALEHSFVSDDFTEWVAWLVEHGLDEGEAAALVLESWPTPGSDDTGSSSDADPNVIRVRDQLWLDIQRDWEEKITAYLEKETRDVSDADIGEEGA